MRVRAQFRRARVHSRRERLRAAGHMLGDGDGGVVAAAQKQAVEHLLHGQCLAHAQIDGRARHAAGVFGGRHFLIQRAVLQRQQRGHDLRGRGHGEALVLVLAKKHAAALRVDQHRTFGGHGQRRRRALSRAHGQKEQEKQYADDPLHGASLPPCTRKKHMRAPSRFCPALPRNSSTLPPAQALTSARRCVKMLFGQASRAAGTGGVWE